MKAMLLALEGDFRAQRTLDQATKIGLEVSVFFGLDARMSSEDELSAIYSEPSSRYAIDRPLSPAEIACVWGHQQMRKRFLTEFSDEWILLLEDDADLLTSRIPSAGDLAMLPAAPIIVTLLGCPADAMEIDRVSVDTERSFTRLLDPPDYAVAYLINRAAANVAVDSYARHKIDSVPDWPYRWSRQVQFWAVDPPSAGIIPMDSLLEVGRLALREKATKRISPQLEHFILCLCGIRLLRGLQLGYPLSTVIRQDMWALLNRWKYQRKRNRCCESSK